MELLNMIDERKDKYIKVGFICKMDFKLFYFYFIGWFKQNIKFIGFLSNKNERQ